MDGRTVPVDERVGELPVGSHDLEAVPLERPYRRAERAKLLTREHEPRNALLVRLDGAGGRIAPEPPARRVPQSRPGHGDRSIGSANARREPFREESRWGGNEVG